MALNSSIEIDLQMFKHFFYTEGSEFLILWFLFLCLQRNFLPGHYSGCPHKCRRAQESSYLNFRGAGSGQKSQSTFASMQILY